MALLPMEHKESQKKFNYKESSLLTFNVNNYSASLDLASNINVAKEKIVALQAIQCVGWSTYSINFSYVPSTGYVWLYTNVATASNIRTQFRVLYEE